MFEKKAITKTRNKTARMTVNNRGSIFRGTRGLGSSLLKTNSKDIAIPNISDRVNTVNTRFGVSNAGLFEVFLKASFLSKLSKKKQVMQPRKNNEPITTLARDRR